MKNQKYDYGSQKNNLEMINFTYFFLILDRNPTRVYVVDITKIKIETA